MYNAFFEFEKNPFAASPDLDFFFRSQQHDASLRGLTFAVQARMGLTSLIGEQGTGKTIVLEAVREALEATQIHCAFLRESPISTKRLFQNIAADLDLPCKGTSPYQVFSALHRFTLQQASKGRTVALIVDEAHDLSSEVLNEILHLASLHDDKVKLLQTIFAGRPELHNTLDALSLDRLKQHAILSCTLEPFSAAETKDYIEFRLTQAGMASQTVFPPSALAEIYRRSRGFAPAIHAVCEGLLLAAFTARSKVCTQDVLDQVFGHPRGEQPRPIDISPTLVAVARIDLGQLFAPPEPEPPTILTTLLHLIFTAVPSFPPPLPLKASQMLDAQQTAPRTVFPVGKFVIPVKIFPTGSKQPIPLVFDAPTRVPPALPVSTTEQLERLSVKVATAWPAQKFLLPALALGSGAKVTMRPGKAIAGATRLDIPVQPAIVSGFISMPAVPKPTVSAEPRSQDKLRRIRPNRVKRVAPSAVVSAAAIDFSSTAVQPSLSSVSELVTSAGILMPKGVNRFVRLSSTVKPHAGITRPRDVQAGSIEVTPATLHPSAKFQPAGEERVAMVPLPTRLQAPVAGSEVRSTGPSAIEFAGPGMCHPNGTAGRATASQLGESALVSLACDLTPVPSAGNVPGGASSIPAAPVLAPMQPEARLEPARTVWRPRVPMTPFGAAKSDPPPARVPGDIQFEVSEPGETLAAGHGRPDRIP